MDIIYRRYYKDVFCYARSLAGNVDIAEEVTQNTFCKAIQAAHKFRGDCDIRVWLCQIAKNDYFNYLRKEKRNVSGFVEEEVFLNVPDMEEPAINRIEAVEEAEEIRNILENMEEPYKTVFSLKVLHEVSYQKIAEVYGKTESWARVTFYRAKAKILDALKK
ncbi:MAG: sigma-70 family RNA polymerase sigma factor [Lachnospiraceae bacterium]|nr:sigma-70 family RNA polymerase sigma factor [Lachnospiraceae bacterium]